MNEFTKLIHFYYEYHLISKNIRAIVFVLNLNQELMLHAKQICQVLNIELQINYNPILLKLMANLKFHRKLQSAIFELATMILDMDVVKRTKVSVRHKFISGGGKVLIRHLINIYLYSISILRQFFLGSKFHNLVRIT